MADKNAGWTSDEAIDWDKVSDEAPPPPEDGIYAFTITKAEPKPTKESKPMISVTLKLTQRFGGEAVNSYVFDNCVFTQEGAFRVKNLAKSLDISLPAGTSYGAIEEFCSTLVGAGAYVKTRLGAPYQGKVSAKVDRYMTEAQAGEAAAGGTATAAAAPPARRPKRGESAQAAAAA